MWEHHIPPIRVISYAQVWHTRAHARLRRTVNLCDREGVMITARETRGSARKTSYLRAEQPTLKQRHYLLIEGDNDTK